MTRWWCRPAVAGLLLLMACSDGGVAIEEPVPTLFPDEPVEEPETEIADPSTTTTTLPVADRLPPLTDEITGAVRSEGALLAIVESDGAAWIVIGPCGGQATIDATDAEVVGPRHVVLDPGHGGDAGGSLGFDGLAEADINLDVARRAAEILRENGVAVALTRDADVDVAASARAALPGALGARAMVSIHHREGGEPASAPKPDVWHQVADPESRRLGGLLYDEVVNALEPFDADWTVSPDGGVKPLLNQRGADFFTVLRESSGTPAVLVELSSIDNPGEEAVWSTDAGRQAEALAVASAVIRFLVDDEEGTGFIEPVERVRTADSGDGSGCS